MIVATTTTKTKTNKKASTEDAKSGHVTHNKQKNNKTNKKASTEHAKSDYVTQNNFFMKFIKQVY